MKRSYSKYETIPGELRGTINKITYGNTPVSLLIQHLRRIADRLEKEENKKTQLEAQIRATFDGTTDASDHT